MNGYSRVLLTGSVVVVMLTILGVQPGSAQSAFVGEIRMVAFDFAPQGCLMCEGQELQIAQHQVLFALLGTKFGGNGQTTFKLPDLRGGIKVGNRTVAVKFVICDLGIFPARP